MGQNAGTKILEAASEEIGKEIGKSIVTAVKYQLNIRCCFSENVETMRKEAKNLEVVRADLGRKITDAWRNEDITSEVDGWLKDTDEIQKTRDEIEAKIHPAQTGCWTKIKSPFSLGNKVKVTTKAMVMHREKVKGFDTLFHSPRPQAALPIPLPRTFALQSRKKMEDDILKAFTEVKVVGIGGMGGLGKTTLAQQIMNRMLVTDKSVDGAVKVVVSQPLDKPNIQDKIAKSLLGCNLEKSETLEARARTLLSKLQGATRLLIVLDDIWEEFTLEELGIPLEGGCMTLLTSRNKDMLGEMHAQVFEMEVLSTEEAQSLFKDKAGPRVDDPDLESIAKQVVDECKGLTIAIITVGSALYKKPKDIWEGCLRDLRRSNPINIKDAIKNVYIPLRKSYDLLDGPNQADARKLFLLCSIFPEDYNIEFEDLVLHSLGLQMFEGANSLEDARFQVRSEILNLKNRCLLLDGYDKNKVKMHDVVRDVAIYIASEGNLFAANLKSKGNSEENNCQWISEFILHSEHPYSNPAYRTGEYFDHLTTIKFPCLRLLIICFTIFGENALSPEDISFLKAMPGLSVLSFQNATIEASPKIIEWPKDLLTLQFKRCVLKIDLSFVGELLNLKVLDCHDCKEIKALPAEIGQLKGLKLLNLSGCSHLCIIAPGIISQLTELEELKMLQSFKGWEPTEVDYEEERRNASLKELESLKKLRRLEIQIEDESLANEVIQLSSRIEKYQICIGYWNPVNFEGFTYEKAISLYGLQSEINDASWIHKLVATTAVEELRLSQDHWGNWRNLRQAQNTVRRLEIKRCEMLSKALVDESTVSRVFPKLGFLELYGLSDLEQLCDGPLPEGSNPFAYLRNVLIWHCSALRSLVLMGSGKDVFQQLETLKIESCSEIEQLFLSNENDEVEGQRSTITFPKLIYLELYELRSLRTLGKGFQSIEFPCLQQLRMVGCEKLESLVSSIESEDKSTPLLCTQKVKFENLETLVIMRCHNIRAIFSFSIIQNLSNLNHVRIDGCEKVEEVMRKQKPEDDGKIGEFTFPKLTELRCGWRSYQV